MQERAHAHVPQVTRIKILDNLLYYLQKGRESLIARGIKSAPPKLILEETYVLIEESNLAHATKYRYKAFIRELARILGFGNIRVRKHAFRKEIQKFSKEAAKELKERLSELKREGYHPESYKTQKIYEEEEYEQPVESPAFVEQPVFEENDYWEPQAGFSDYENLTQYYDWEG